MENVKLVGGKTKEFCLNELKKLKVDELKHELARLSGMKINKENEGFFESEIRGYISNLRNNIEKSFA